jgi:hypothetical protein
MSKSFSKRWACARCNRDIGEIVQDSHRVSTLSLFRSALKPGQAADGYAVEGLAAGVVICSHCGHRQEWRLSNRLIRMSVQAS